MLMLLFIPIFYVVACAHRYLQLFAPSNLLIARVRTSPPRWRTVMLLMALAYALVGAMHFLSTAIENGAPSWLNLLVMVLAWDAIKIGLLAVMATLRRIRLVVATAAQTVTARLSMDSVVLKGQRGPTG